MLGFNQTIDVDAALGALERHEHVAFQLSGGRDSIAALFAMRAFWSRLTVYHLDTGDQFPETRSVVDAIARLLPVARIVSSSQQFHEQVGLPSDVVPVDNLPFGRMVSGNPVKIVSRYDCCSAVLMLPLYQRMVADGITLIVRGQRDGDYTRAPIRSGQSDGTFEVLFPIQHWTDQDVDSFIHELRLPVGDFYKAGMATTPDCMGCTAWWGEGRLPYLRDRYPERHADVAAKITLIKNEIDRQYSTIAQDI